MSDPISSARNPGIDLLRGLSIVLVVMHHTALRIPLEKGVLGDWLPEWLLYGIQYDGFEAVFLFFVISGFLITSNSLARWGTLAAIDARAFYRRRAARILPCLLILVAVLSGAGAGRRAALHDGTAEADAGRHGRCRRSALRVNVYQADTGWLPAGWGVLWSLSIEEVFYLAFPVVCLLLGRTRLLVPALLLLALSIPVVRSQHPPRRDLGGGEHSARHGRASPPACSRRCWCGAGRRARRRPCAGRSRWASSACWPSSSRATSCGTRCAWLHAGADRSRRPRWCIASHWRAVAPRRRRRGAPSPGCARSDASATRSTSRTCSSSGSSSTASTPPAPTCAWASPGIRRCSRARGRWAGWSRASSRRRSSAPSLRARARVTRARVRTQEAAA